MVCFGTVGFALSVVVVLEFDSACWAVCDAQCLCSCEYLFSELFVFLGACSAHLLFSLSFLFCLLFVLGGGASQRQRDERLHRLTLLCVLCVLSSSLCFSLLLAFLCLWVGVCCVVRAQPCEHARDTTRAFVFWFVYLMYCVLLLPQHTVCCSHHTLFVVNDRHAHR